MGRTMDLTYDQVFPLKLLLSTKQKAYAVK